MPLDKTVKVRKQPPWIASRQNSKGKKAITMNNASRQRVKVRKHPT